MITTTSLPVGNVGQNYAATLTATGGFPPYTWKIAGSLPPGINLDSSSGNLSGTPTTGGDYSFGAIVTDSQGQSARNPNLSIFVNVPITINNSSPLPTATVGVGY
jgi:hypothetical protein